MPLTVCPATHYVAVGATANGDRGCVVRTQGTNARARRWEPYYGGLTPPALRAACSHGTYYVYQPDAADGTTLYSDACVGCPEGTSSWHSSGLHHALHTNTECVPVSDVPNVCLDGVTYYSARRHALDTSVNVSAACLPCTVCGGARHTVSECNITTNTVCSAVDDAWLADPPTPPCNPGFYYNSFGALPSPLSSPLLRSAPLFSARSSSSRQVERTSVFGAPDVRCIDPSAPRRPMPIAPPTPWWCLPRLCTFTSRRCLGLPL